MEEQKIRINREQMELVLSLEAEDSKKAFFQFVDYCFEGKPIEGTDKPSDVARKMVEIGRRSGYIE